MKEVVVVIGPGSIGQAIARRVSVGKHVLLGDLHEVNAGSAAKVLGDAGYDVSAAVVDVSSRESVRPLVAKAAAFGSVTGAIHAAGVSPSQASGHHSEGRSIRHGRRARGIWQRHRSRRIGSGHRLAVGPPTAWPHRRGEQGSCNDSDR